MISDTFSPIPCQPVEWPVKSELDGFNSFSASDFPPLPMTIAFTPQSNLKCAPASRSKIEISKYSNPLQLARYSDFCKDSRERFGQKGKTHWAFSFTLKMKRSHGFKIILQRTPCVCTNTSRCGPACRCFINHCSNRRIFRSSFKKRPSRIQIKNHPFAYWKTEAESQESCTQPSSSKSAARQPRLYRTRSRYRSPRNLG